MSTSSFDNPWKILGERKIYDNPWISVTEYAVLNPAGNKGIYGKVHFKNYAVGVVPLDEHHQITLVGQYRFTLNQYSWEIPEGGCPEGEDPLDAAKRELLEETGLVAARWDLLFTQHLSNSVTDEYGYAYLARDLQQCDAKPEETEKLMIKKVSVEEAYKMVEAGEITDSLTVAAIFKIKLLFCSGEL